MIYFGGIALFVVGFIIGHRLGVRKGEENQQDYIESQFYSLYFFLNGEARKVIELVHSDLNKMGFIDEAMVKERVNQYRKNQKQNGKDI
jgi:hypothetical protein